MASTSSFLSEDQFRCTICLEVFNNPVTIPCGHNFCQVCITQHFDSSDLWKCPVCDDLFYRLPDLKVNNLISEMVTNFGKLVAVKDSSCTDQQCAKPGEVPCDVCTGTKIKAVKSCLVCVASYCKTHLEPHQRIIGMKRHQLMDPVENLEDRICKKHDRPLEMFCQTEEVCVCQFCSESNHKLHLIVPLKEEYELKKAQLGQTEAEVQQMIQERQLKIQQIQHTVKLSQNDADREIADGMKVCTALMHSIERSQAKLISTIQDKHKSTEIQAEGFIKELKEEIMELTKRRSQLEKLSHTEDHLNLLQIFPSLTTPPHTKDWTLFNVHQPSYVGSVRRALDQLEKTLSIEMKKLCGAELKKVKQEAVDVSLDPETAHPDLILSENGKQVYHEDVRKNLPDNPERFYYCVMVLGKESWSSGRFYYEVEVKGKTKWDLGVARGSINRKEKVAVNPENGFWAVRWRNGSELKVCVDPTVLLFHREKPQKVGVFVDYKEGLVSFYDVDIEVHIYSFTSCIFTEPLYPYFSPCLNEDGTNSNPLIITPV